MSDDYRTLARQSAEYRRLARQAEEADLFTPPPYNDTGKCVAWRSGYLDALRDMAEGKLTGAEERSSP